MNRSFGTSSFPRARQYDGLRKSADVYLGGTWMSRPFHPRPRDAASPMSLPRHLSCAAQNPCTGRQPETAPPRPQAFARESRSPQRLAAPPTMPAPTPCQGHVSPRPRVARHSSEPRTAGRIEPEPPVLQTDRAATLEAPSPAASPMNPATTVSLYSGFSSRRIKGFSAISSSRCRTSSRYPAGQWRDFGDRLGPMSLEPRCLLLAVADAAGKSDLNARSPSTSFGGSSSPYVRSSSISPYSR